MTCRERLTLRSYPIEKILHMVVICITLGSGNKGTDEAPRDGATADGGIGATHGE